MKHFLKTLLKWFDTQSEIGSDNGEDSKAIDWLRCFPFLFLHLACLSVIWVGWSWIAIWIASALYLIRMFSITAFYHRYFSHRSFKTSRRAQFLFALFGSLAAQRGPLWWAAHHRHHHKYSDKQSDVHSPKYDGFWWSHMFWFTNKKNFHIRSKLIPDLIKYPELRFIDRFDSLMPFLLGVSLFYLGYWLESAVPTLETNGPQMLVWGFFISTVLLFHATCSTNSLAHIFGRQRFSTNDHSKNNILIAILTFGEGWHNNHHHFPNVARQGIFWWEIDITYFFLSIMSKLGIIWDLNQHPKRLISKVV